MLYKKHMKIPTTQFLFMHTHTHTLSLSLKMTLSKICCRLITDLYALHNFSSQLWQTVQTGSSMIVEKKSALIGSEEILISPHFASFLLQNEFICYIEAQSGAKVQKSSEFQINPVQ